MVFITHCLIKFKQIAQDKPYQWLMANGLRLMLLMLCLTWVSVASAENIYNHRAQGQLLPNGQVLISTRFHIELPTQLESALQQGVELEFDLDYQLERPRIRAYHDRIKRWFNRDETTSIAYKLTYHPLTNRYRVAVGSFYTEYQNLDSALKAVGSVVNWQVLPEGSLKNEVIDDIQINVRLSLSTSRLPKPFQLNILTSKNWDLDSGEVPITLKAAP